MTDTVLVYDNWLSEAKIESQTSDALYNSVASRLSEKPTRQIPACYITKAIAEAVRSPGTILSGLRMRDLVIVGELKLTSYHISFPLHFVNCWFVGRVECWQARTRTLGFRGCVFEQGADFTATRIEGHLLLRENFRSDGPIIARDMIVEGQVDLSGAELLYEWKENDCYPERVEGECFGFSRSTASAIYIRQMGHRPAGVVSLRDVEVKTLKHDFDGDRKFASWPSEGRLILQGLRYERLEGEKPQCPPTRALEWLDLQAGFYADTFTVLARAYKNAGLLDAAEDVLTALKKREIASMRPSLRKLAMQFVYLLIGYGKTPGVALVAFIAVLVLSYAAAWGMASFHYVTPSVNEFLLEPCYYSADHCVTANVSWHTVIINPAQVSRRVPDTYPEFSPLAYAVESLVPGIEFDQKKFWEPSILLLKFLFSILSALGLFVGGVFIGSITGLLVPRADKL